MEMGGVEGVLITILRNLDPEKYDINLLLNYKQGEFLGRVPSHVKVFSVGGSDENFSAFTPIRFLQKAIRRYQYWKFQKSPKQFYQSNNLLDCDFEIAFSHYMIPDILNSPNLNSKKIFWFHGDLRNSGLSFDENTEVVRQMQKFDKGVFVSYFSKNIVEETWKTALDNSIVIHNPILTEEILQQATEFPAEHYNFISSGRLFRQKGFLDFIKAHERLIKEGYKLESVILGDGDQRNELEEYLSSNQLSESFKLLGYKDNPHPFVKAADYFVLPSYSEGYPLVIAEALLLDTPVLSTNVGGISEMIENDKNGLLFEPGEENVYHAMKKVLDQQITFSDDLQDDIVSKNQSIFKEINQLFNPQ